jgi:hypothetical protein
VNLLKSFSRALASSRPLIDSLVASGAITNPQASAIATDFDGGAKCGLALQNEFASAQTRADKFAAAARAQTCFRVILDRHHFEAHPRVQTAANIAKGILDSLVIFYSDSSDAVDGPRRAPVRRDEKAFEAELEQQVKALKEAMKGN